MKKFKAWIATVFLSVFFGLRLYYIWSHVYRFIWQRQYKGIEIAPCSSYADLATRLRKLKWKADGFKELGDVLMSPHWFQKVLYFGDGKDGSSVGDCGVFACYAAEVLKQFPDTTPYILTVMWMDKDGKYGGHNVALVKYRGAFDGPHLFWYVDYGLPSPDRDTATEVVWDVMNAMAPGGTLLAVAAATPALKMVEFFTAKGLSKVSK